MDMEDAITEAEDAGDNDLADQKQNEFNAELIRLSKMARGASESDPSILEDSLFTIASYTSFLGEQIEAFVKYHIQDNSVFYGAEFKIDTVHVGHEASYETAYMNKKNQFEKLRVRSNSNGIFVRDTQSNSESECNTVSINKYSVTNEPLFNIMCREYEYNGSNMGSVTEIETSSFVVIHQIDEPLCNGVIKF